MAPLGKKYSLEKTIKKVENKDTSKKKCPTNASKITKNRITILNVHNQIDNNEMKYAERGHGNAALAGKRMQLLRL